MRERLLAGIAYLEAVSELVRRGRRMHPTKGLYEAGELQWWWAEGERSTDELGQLFWFDDAGRPDAAVIITEWREWVSLDPIVLPDATADRVAHVVERGLAHAAAAGFDTVQLEVDRDDHVLLDVLAGHGFAKQEDGMVESWLDADARPEISPLHEGYRLMTRRDRRERPHHMADRLGPDVERRLLQTPLYRPDLDLVVVDRDDEPAARGLFWYDPEIAIGVVEPMRTADDHQRRGLARHVLTAGLERLAGAGATRISIGYGPGNPASGPLYRDVGFVPHQQTDLVAGPTRAARPVST